MPKNNPNVEKNYLKEGKRRKLNENVEKEGEKGERERGGEEKRAKVRNKLYEEKNSNDREVCLNYPETTSGIR